MGMRGPIPIDKAIGIAEFAVLTGRVPHPNVWVDSLIDAAADAELEGLF